MIMSLLPCLFAISLYSFFYQSGYFIASHGEHAWSKELGMLRRCTDIFFNLTLYTVIPQLIFIIVLSAYLLERKQSIKWPLTCYLSGMIVLLFTIIVDPAGALLWYWD
jgi:hypothetical protein